MLVRSTEITEVAGDDELMNWNKMLGTDRRCECVRIGRTGGMEG